MIFLAIGPSWIATMLWNRASLRVPRAVAGQLIVFEPMSAFVLVHLLAGRGPSPVEFVGEVLLVVGAALALRRLGSGRVEGGDQVVGPGQERIAGLVAG